MVFDSQDRPKPPSPEVRRKAREIVERSGANSEERFNKVVLGTRFFVSVQESGLRKSDRRFGAYRETTVPTISYALDKHVYPVIGDLALSQVNNKTCKPLVAAMFDSGLSVCSVNNYMKLVLQIVRSLRDAESGLPIHNLKWNREYLDLPKINRDEQNVLAFDAEQINKLNAEMMATSECCTSFSP